MRLQLVFVICVFAFEFSIASNLSTKYLPPNYTGSSGGHLRNPNAALQRPSNQYLAPHTSNLHYHGVAGAGHRLGSQYASSSGSSYGAGGGRGGARAAAHIPIIRQDFTHDGSGNYNFGFETGNGIRRDEKGEFRGGWPHGSQSVSGSYSYTGDDGHLYKINYKADTNGFHAEGDHLPTPPPIPYQIQQSIGHGGGAYGGGVRYGGSYAGAASVPSSKYLPPGRRH